MPLPLEFNSTAPGVTIARIRSDFEAIWKQNVVPVTRERATDSQAGDYFHEGDAPGIVTATVYLNIQGQSSDKYAREKYGISTTGAVFKAYARHFEDLQNLDVIIWNDRRFILKELNKAYHNGAVGFQEFDLVHVDFVPNG